MSELGWQSWHVDRDGLGALLLGDRGRAWTTFKVREGRPGGWGIAMDTIYRLLDTGG